MSKCVHCGKEFEMKQCVDGRIEGGIVFRFMNGSTYSVCKECIIGMEKDREELGIGDDWEGDD